MCAGHAIAGRDPDGPKEVGEAVGQSVELEVGHGLAAVGDRHVLGRLRGPVADQLVYPGGRIKAHHDSPSMRAMIVRCISDVPEKMRAGMESRSNASTPVSMVTPEPPKICTASRPDCTAASETHSLHMATASSHRLPCRCSSPAR